jgi:tol-pal system beta propeller repeat protein TolB
VNLINDPFDERDIAWSPDGCCIAFTTDRHGRSEIYLVSVAEGWQQRLTDVQSFDPPWSGRDYQPAWSPDGEYIAFGSERDDNYDIYLMKADGSGLTRLTDHPAGDWGPTWSPDGNYIAFGSDRDGNPEIYVMNPDGSDQVNLTDYPGRDETPVWSPDSQYIAFVSERDENFDIYVTRVDGSGLSRLTTDPFVDRKPAWSPDGRFIAFVTNRGGGDDNEIYVVEVSE